MTSAESGLNLSRPIMKKIFFMSNRETVIIFLTHWGQDKMATTLADNIFKCKFVNGNILISMKNLLKFVPKGPINNMPALV